MQKRGIEADVTVIGAAAEEVDSASTPYHIRGPFPGLGFADGLYGYVSAAAARQAAHGSACITEVVGPDHFVGAHGGGAIHLRLTPSDRDDPRLIQFGDAYEHQADGT